MSLSKMTKEEIELLSYTDIAKLYLEEKNCWFLRKHWL
mgnify:CR=1 FL=1